MENVVRLRKGLLASALLVASAAFVYGVVGQSSQAQAQEEWGLHSQREGRFTLINPSDVDIPIQLWDGEEWYNDTVPNQARLTIYMPIDGTGHSHHQPAIRFDNSQGQIKTYTLEFYEIYQSSDRGKPYKFAYDEDSGWDLSSMDSAN